MKMNVFPFALLSVPNASLFHCSGNRLSLVNLLRQSDVRNDGDVAHNADVRSNDGRLDWVRSACRGQVEIVVVELESIYQIAERFGFEAGQRFIADFSIGIPVTSRDRYEKLLCQFQNCITIRF